MKIMACLAVLLLLAAPPSCSIWSPGEQTIPPDLVTVAQGVVDAGHAGTAAPQQLLDAAALILATEEAIPGTYPAEAVAFARAVLEAQGEPLPPSLVSVAQWVLSVHQAELRHAEEDPGWLGRSLDWLLLLVQGYGAVALGAGMTSSRWWSMLGVALKALNPTSGTGLELGKAANAALAAMGARHSGELLAPTPPKGV